jgi:hypothetical protein
MAGREGSRSGLSVRIRMSLMRCGVVRVFFHLAYLGTVSSSSEIDHLFLPRVGHDVLDGGETTVTGIRDLFILIEVGHVTRREMVIHMGPVVHRRRIGGSRKSKVAGHLKTPEGLEEA